MAGNSLNLIKLTYHNFALKMCIKLLLTLFHDQEQNRTNETQLLLKYTMKSLTGMGNPTESREKSLESNVGKVISQEDHLQKKKKKSNLSSQLEYMRRNGCYFRGLKKKMKWFPWGKSNKKCERLPMMKM